MKGVEYEGIAIIGAAGRFPGAETVEALWANLVAGVESITYFSDADLTGSGLDPQALRQRGAYIPARGVLQDADCFDAAFFGIPPKEAEVMDPQQRVFLETCWTAVERAGYAPDRLPGVVGVFGGVTFNTYYPHVLHGRPDLRALVGADLVMFGNERDYLTTRVAYRLGLTGPAVNVSTACSTSLVAVCQACHALLAYQCDTAVAGGASITVPQKRGYFYDEGHIGSSDGHTRTFDERAAGTVFGNGVGVVVLKRLEDAVRDRDQLYAVIKGAAINNDGAQRVSFGAPGIQGQADVIAMAHALAGFDPASISYVEAHGTATPLGDPIEIAGLTRAFRLGTDRRQFCAIGSVKTNVGHLDVASGVTGLIKTALALHHRVIPASLHYHHPNPRLALDESPFYVNARTREWTTADGVPRRAGVSSFGTGGTNAHMVLEEAPEMPASGPSRPEQLLIVSAKTADALERATDNLAMDLRQGAPVADRVDSAAPPHALADTAFTLHTGRSSFPHRRVVVCREALDGAVALEARAPGRVSTHLQRMVNPPVVFMFPGQGSQYHGMGADLYGAEPVFRRELDRCADLLEPRLGLDIRTVMFPDRDSDASAPERLAQTRFTQPALFVIEYALAHLWMSWGIEPAAMIGHSVGEYVAACLAGVFSLDDALLLVARRGELVQALPGGAMLAVRLPEADLRALLDDSLAIAAINAPSMCVVSGPDPAVAALETRLAARGVSGRRLRTSHAFHSPMMQPAVGPFTSVAQGVALAPPRIPYVSNVTARWITDAEATSPDYWAGQLRHAVRFGDGIAELMADERRVFLEVGPGRALSTLAQQHPSRSAGRMVVASMPTCRQEQRGALTALGALWMAGAVVDWGGFYRDESRRRIVLSPYPFERARCWPEALEPAIVADGSAAAADVMPERMVVNAAETVSPVPASTTAPPVPGVPRRARLGEEIRTLLEQLSGMGLDDADPSTPFVALGLDSLLLTQVGAKVRVQYGVRVSFRQLMEELSWIDALAGYLDEKLPAEALPATPGPVAAPETPAASGVASGPAHRLPTPAAADGGPLPAAALITALLSQQQAITSKVLDLLALQTSSVDGMHGPAARSILAVVGDVPAPVRGPGAAPASSALEAKPSGPFHPIGKAVASTLTPSQLAFVDALIARYTARTGLSKRHTQAHRARLADPRSMAGFRAQWKEMVYPLVIERSSGSRLWDLDGNEYIDFTMGFGTNLLGHSPPFVVSAIDEQLHKGIEVGPQTPLAGSVAALMCELTGMERCAFANTGSEAVLAAIRAARTVTGRNRIVYFTGDYHGIFDEVLQRVSGRPGEQRLMAAAPGIPVQPSGHVLILDYDRPESIETIRAAGPDIAAVIVEPVQSRYPDLQPRAFLRQLRDVTRETGSALVFDEVITGFRSHLGGVQALFDIRADMATYGKVIGGGLPIGALCGDALYLDALDGGLWQYGDSSIPESGVTFFAGTYVRHPLAMAAAWATLSHLKREGGALQQRLNDRMDAAVHELNGLLAEARAPLHIEHFSSLFWIRMDPKSPHANLIFFLLRDKGIHIFEGRLFFLSTAHTDADVRRLIGAFMDSVREMQAVGLLSGQEDVVRRDAASGPLPTGADGAAPDTRAASPDDPRVATTPGLALVPSSRSEPAIPSDQPMKFGVYFFGSYPAAFTPTKYQLLLDTATFADTHGFSAIWIPERHFHAVGGFSPNPAVVAAALAVTTRHIHLRAGSVVLPLHHPIRVAEEWSVVDNLSRGRVGLSIASGWHPNDFVFAPDAYQNRRELATEGIETIRRLWAGDSIAALGGTGQELNVSLHPMPMQPALPLWLTCVQAGSYEKAGELGVGVLAMLTNQTLDEVAAKIALYRAARLAHGHDPATGNVTLLVHTFVGADHDTAVATARGPMREYLRSYLDNSQARRRAEGASEMDAADLEYLLDRSFDDYMNGKTLFGTAATCAGTVARLREIGVNELGCFLDFGVDAGSVLASLPFLDDLKRRCERPSTAAAVPARGAIRMFPKAATSEPLGVAATLPLTESQQGLSLLARLAPDGNRAYTEVTTLRLRGPLDADLVAAALQTIVDRHEGLRTTIDADGEHQTIHPHAALRVPLVDLSGMSEAVQRDGLAAEFAGIEAHPFDFSRAPGLRAGLLRLAADHHLLVLTFHHLFGNGPSYSVFFDELVEVYAALRDGAEASLEPPMQLGGYVRWREQQIDAPEFEQDRQFWLRQFADTMPVLDLPTDYPRPAVMTYRGSRESLTIDGPLTARLRTVSGTLRASLFMTLFAAFNVLIHRMSGATDIVVGVPFEGEARALPGGAHLFANTTNMIPFRSRIGPAATFAQLVSDTKSLVLGASEHQAYFFGRLLQELHVRPDLSRPPMFAASFNLERGLFRRRSGALDVELAIEDVPFGNPRGASKFELAVNIVDTGAGLRIDCDYSSQLFTPGTVRRWLGQYRILLDGIASDPAQAVGALSLLTAADRRQVVEDWNATNVAYPGPWTLHEAFERQADRTPNLRAVTYDGVDLSYRQLERRANRLANHLATLGAGPERLVGICAERSLEMVIGLLGILKAGAAYVPIDPSYPSQRIAFMLEDAGASLLLTQDHLRGGLPLHDAITLCLDADWPVIGTASADRPVTATGPDNLAYMIYTSGSTGTPKGALNTHGAIANRLRWMQDAYPLVSGDAVLQKTPFSFDVSVWEFFWPLMTGARLVLAAPGGHQAPDYLVQVINREQISVMHFVPSMLRVFLETRNLTSCTSLRDVICSGEALPADIVDGFHRILPGTLHNLYGPTEAAVDVTSWTCLREGQPPSIPIGHPIANTRCYILDRDLNPVLPGPAAGELYLGGVQVGRGYHGRPDLTAERFIPDPFSPQAGARLYRTGDLCRYLVNGAIEYVGRIDHQVKLRGFRIELEEIEAALARHESVKQCVVVAYDAAPGDQRLVAYVESASTLASIVDDWRAHLTSVLPDFMVPWTFVVMPALPLSSNGKVDRRALPRPGDPPAPNAAAPSPPRTETTRRLAVIWEDLLGVTSVQVTDDFFRLGGHSLLAMRLVNRIHAEFGVELPPSALFEHPALADLARRIDPAPIATVPPLRIQCAAPLEAPAVSQKVLIQMESGGDGTPFFWVHGIGGEVFCYMQVSRHLAPARPVYGFTADWTKMTGIAEPTLDAMAALYIRELRRVQPSGPYHLGGLCSGAKLALEMARQLEAAGDEVGVLAAIDCDLQPIQTSPTGVRAIGAFFRNVPHWVREDAVASGGTDLVGRLRSRIRRARGLSRRPGGAADTAARGQVDLRDALGMWRFPDYQVQMLQLHHHAIESYRARPFNGTVIMFVPRTAPLFGPWPRSYDPCWDQLARGGVKAFRVAGSHSTMMSDPFVAEIASRLNEAIVAAERSGARPHAGRRAPQVGSTRTARLPPVSRQA